MNADTLQIADEDFSFALEAMIRAKGYQVSVAPQSIVVEAKRPEQTVAEYNAVNLLKIYGGHDPEAALIVLTQLARSAGLPQDSLDRFLAAGYVPQPKQLPFHAAARAADRPQGPTRIATGGSRGGGKALALDTPIPTPNGWTTMADVEVGDLVFAKDGCVTPVTATSEVMLGNDCFRVVFSDGYSIVADAEHRWLTFSKRERVQMRRRNDEWRAKRRAKRPLRGRGLSPSTVAMNKARKYKYLPQPEGTVRTTREIALTLYSDKRGEINHSVPLAGPINPPEAVLPIHPYVLGVWLGDGMSESPYLTCFDPEICQELAVCGYPARETNTIGRFYITGLSRPALRALGVHLNKHIPPQYLRGSLEQRLALLQGLMDTDGSAASDDGGCEFTSTRYQLAAGTLELALSLGIKATISEGVATLNGREIGPKWRIRFSTALPVFRLPRKLDLQKRSGFNGVTTWRYITAVIPVPSVPVKCIAVGHPSHCFLAGERFIPTHNTTAVLAQVVIDDCQRTAGLKFLFLRKVLKSARESFEDLRRTTLMGIDHDYKASRNLLELPNGSRVILGHYGTEKDIDSYLGLEYDGVAIEETTQLSESKIKDIGSCIRTSKPNWRPREYDTANPGGVSHAGFKRDFIEPMRKGTETTTRFIPSGHDDNVFLNPEYIFNLSRLTGWKEKAWKEGDWDIAAGQFFSTWNYNAVVKKGLQIMPGEPVWAALDYGFQHPTVAYLFSSYDGKIRVIAEHWRQKALVSENADDIKAMLDRHDIALAQLKVFYAGHDVFASRGSETGKTIANEYAEHGIKLTKAYIDRINRAGTILKLLGSPARGIEPLIEISDTCVRLIECIPAMVHDPHRPEDVLKVDVDEDGNNGDDSYDALGHGVAQKPKKGRTWVGV